MAEIGKPADWIVFDAVEIDLAGRRLFVAGIDVRLEPKAFAVLALLAQHPGRAFGRDEILDAVWGHRHVTAGVLNRVVTLLRQALGQSAENRHYVHTLHGIGYRFDAQVRMFHERPVSIDAGTGAPDAQPPIFASALAPLAETADRRSTFIASTARDASADPLTLSTPLADSSSGVLPTPALRRARARAVVILCVLLTSVAGLLWLHQALTPVPTPSPVLVVLPLHVIGEDSREIAFADGLSEELTTRLARVNGLRLISSTSALRAQKEGLDAQQLAERLHVTHAIEGSLREAGDQLRIDLRLIETPSGRTLWAQNYDRKFADVFALQEEMAQAVASALALHTDLANANSPAADPQVFRDYLELRHIFFSQSNEAAYTKAETELNALAARAKDFAPAHGLLAVNLAAGYEGGGRQADALHEARQALDIDPNDLYAHAALGMVATYSRDWTTVKQEYDAALALSPSDGIMHCIVGMWLARLGYSEQALSEFEKLYQSDPLNYWVIYNRATELDTLGRHDEARHYLDLLPGLESQSPWMTATARWRNAVWRHDYIEARQLVEHMSDQSGEAKAYLAVTEAMLEPKLWPQADRAIAAVESDSGQSSTLRLFEPQLKRAAALELFEHGNQEPDGKILWAVDFSTLRHEPEFQNFLRRMKFIDFWRSNGWPLQCKPDGDSARCK